MSWFRSLFGARSDDSIKPGVDFQTGTVVLTEDEHKEFDALWKLIVSHPEDGRWAMPTEMADFLPRAVVASCLLQRARRFASCVRPGDLESRKRVLEAGIKALAVCPITVENYYEFGIILEDMQDIASAKWAFQSFLEYLGRPDRQPNDPRFVVSQTVWKASRTSQFDKAESIEWLVQDAKRRLALYDRPVDDANTAPATQRLQPDILAAAKQALLEIRDRSLPDFLDVLQGEKAANVSDNLKTRASDELLVFVLHLTERIAQRDLGADGTNAFMEALLAFLGNDLQPDRKAILQGLFNTRVSFYRTLDMPTGEKGAGLAGTLFWEFGKLMTSPAHYSDPPFPSWNPITMDLVGLLGADLMIFVNDVLAELRIFDSLKRAPSADESRH
jgi:hypothetical protein